MSALTPVEARGGRWYKRDDLHRHPSGVNGGKWRQCAHLVEQLAGAGHRRIVSGASVLSPQLAMTAVAAQLAGLPCTLVIGTRPESAVRHPSPQLAVEHGAELHPIRVGYNPALQREVRLLAAVTGAGILHYGVSPAPDASLDELRAFHWLGGRQALDLAERLPDLRSLVVPFGSGNSAASILWGLAHAPAGARPRVVRLVGIGPSRWEWLWRRLDDLGLPEVTLRDLRRRTRLTDLHGPGHVKYEQRRPYTSDGVELHPTYEGKVAAWLDEHPGIAPGWADRDGTSALWIIGAPVH